MADMQRLFTQLFPGVGMDSGAHATAQEVIRRATAVAGSIIQMQERVTEAVSPDGGVRIRVDGRGRVVELYLNPRVPARTDPVALGELVVQIYREAVAVSVGTFTDELNTALEISPAGSDIPADQRLAKLDEVIADLGRTTR